MKTKEKVWIKNPQKEVKMKATLGSDGKLRISKNLFEKLPEHIKFNFDVRSRFLYIAEGTKGDENSYKKHNTMTVHGLSFEIVRENISLPIRLNFKYSYEEMQWVGKIDISKNSKDFGNQILIIHKGLIDYLVYTKAHSTPCEDRRQIANIAIFEARKIYNPSYGDFDEFARWFVTKRLKEENKKYVQSRRMLSLDASRRNVKGDSWCLYDKLGDKFDTALSAAENITYESLKTNIEEQSKLLMKMLLEGYTLSEISDALDMSTEDVYKLAKMIGEGRKSINLERSML